MNLKEIIMKFKEGNSVDKLGIISSIVTIISAVVTLIAGQILTIRFVFDDTSSIRIAFYIIAMGLSLLLIYAFFLFISFTKKEITHYLLRFSVLIIVFGTMIILLSTIWGALLSIQ